MPISFICNYIECIKLLLEKGQFRKNGLILQQYQFPLFVIKLNALQFLNCYSRKDSLEKMVIFLIEY